MSTSRALYTLHNILRKNNKDLFDNNVDVRQLFNSHLPFNNPDAEKAILISLDSYDISIVSCDDMGSNVFRYMFRDFYNDYVYTSHNLEDFVEKVKEYIPFIIIDALESNVLKREGFTLSYILHRN